jgi:MSHA pilin protein MshC
MSKKLELTQYRSSCNGFTLVELITTLVLLGILAVFALPRMAGLNFFQDRAYFDEVVAAVRYAQKRAVASGCETQAQLTAAPAGFGLFQRATDCTTGAFTRPVINPGSGEPFARPAPAGVAVAPAANITFDAMGRATTGAGVWIAVGGRSLRVVGETGFVETN